MTGAFWGLRDALEAMQQLCAADVDVPLGSLTYTGMLNPHGGYEADVTVTRVGEAEFLVVSGTAQATKDMAWIRRQIGALGLNAVATDVSSSLSLRAESPSLLSKLSWTVTT